MAFLIQTSVLGGDFLSSEQSFPVLRSPAPDPVRVLQAAAQKSSFLQILTSFSRSMIFSLPDQVEKLPALADGWTVGIAFFCFLFQAHRFYVIILLTLQWVLLDSCLMLQCSIQFSGLIG